MMRTKKTGYIDADYRNISIVIQSYKKIFSGFFNNVFDFAVNIFPILLQAFKNAYSFIKDIKQTEKEQLYKELSRTEDDDRKADIKYLIQRIVSLLLVTVTKSTLKH